MPVEALQIQTDMPIKDSLERVGFDVDPAEVKPTPLAPVLINDHAREQEPQHRVHALLIAAGD